MKHAVFVPGFWHGTWCWGFVTPELASRQIPTVAVDLQGQGLQGVAPTARWARPFDSAAFAVAESKAAAVTATSAAEALIAQLRVIGGGDPSLVVAHSAGGVAATVAAEIEPSLFSHIVYVSALVPVSGQPAGVDYGSPENAGELGTGLLRGDPLAIGVSRIDNGDGAAQDQIREAMYADVPVDIADAVISLLTTDAPAGVVIEPVSVTRERFGSIPHTYILCTEDRMMKPALQRRIVADIDGCSAEKTRTVELHSSHSPFLSQPRPLADAIEAAWKLPPKDLSS